MLDLKFYLKRIGRGSFVIDGTITVGKDLTDKTIVYAEVFYSPRGQQFVRTPFVVRNMPISKFFNTFYKDILFKSYKECSTNLPINDKSETFVPPLTKRVMILENCTFSNEDMPSHLRPGYYKLKFGFTNEVETTMIFLAKVEPK